jgi:hypothetical protein
MQKRYLIYTLRLAYIAGLSLTHLTGCDESFDYSGIVPNEIILEGSLSKQREIGICSIQVFRLDSTFLDKLKKEGISMLQASVVPRSWPKKIRFGPWRDEPLYRVLNQGSLRDVQSSKVSECLQSLDPSLAKLYNQRSTYGGAALYTFSESMDRREGNDFLYLIVDAGIIIVSPH